VPSSSLIRIDIEVHQFLESRKTDPTQTHNDILREMIGLPLAEEIAVIDRAGPTPGLSRAWNSQTGRNFEWLTMGKCMPESSRRAHGTREVRVIIRLRVPPVVLPEQGEELG
jgi:hypothetical protein